TADGSCFRRSLRTAPQPDQPFAQRSAIRSGGAAPGDKTGSDDILIPCQCPPYDFYNLTRFAVRKRTILLHTHSRNLVIDARAIVRELAWLSLHLDGTGTL